MYTRKAKTLPGTFVIFLREFDLLSLIFTLFMNIQIQESLWQLSICHHSQEFGAPLEGPPLFY